jgi:hypothetical protein
MQLASVGLENTEDNRRTLREFLFTAEDVGSYISGVVSTSHSTLHTHPGQGASAAAAPVLVHSMHLIWHTEALRCTLSSTCSSRLLPAPPPPLPCHPHTPPPPDPV